VTGLLDTQAFMWMDSDPAKLSLAATVFVLDPANTLLVSVVSVWEIVIKHQIGKLPLNRPLEDILRDQLARNIQVLDVNLGHVLAVRSLPIVHKDPFDRLLAAQAIVEGAVLVTADPVFGQYPVQVVW
jgi:PIN domain nuclease of toxin-antitoxin system